MDIASKEGWNELGYISPSGTLHFYDSDLEFGRSPFDMLASFIDKVKYAIASVGRDDSIREEIEAVMYEIIPGLKKIEYPTEYDGTPRKRVPYYGGIDHESSGLLSHFLKTNNITIRDFLLNTQYVVWVDGDEYQIKQKLVNQGIIHPDDFIKL